MTNGLSSPQVLSQTLIVSRDSEAARTNDLSVGQQVLSDESGLNPAYAESGTENSTALGDEVAVAYKPIGNPSMRSLGLFALSPVATGLTVFNVRDSSLLPLAKQVVTKWVLEKTNALGIPGPEVKSVISVFSGNPRQQEQARVIAAANTSVSNGVSHEFKICAARGKLVWTSDEGLCIALPMIVQANECLIFEQMISGPITPAVAQGLMQIASAAQRAGAFVILLLVCLGDCDSLQLMPICDEVIEVAPCEPDVGDDAAFSFDCVGVRELNSIGIGKTMCSVQFADGAFHYRYEPFISSNLETRVMWTMRGQGMKLDDIGAQFKMHKTSVMRRLESLPKPRHLDLPKDWLSNNLEMFSVPSRGAKSNADGERVGDDAESKTSAEPLVKPLRY